MAQPSDANVVLRLPEAQKDWLRRLADARGVSISDLVKQAISTLLWAESPVELRVVHTNSAPEFIDLMNVAPYPIHLVNYIVADSTFDSTGEVTNTHRHTCHFGPLVVDLSTGERKLAVLDPGRVVRVFTQNPTFVPANSPTVQVWTSLGMGAPIWNDHFERVTFYRVVRQDTQPIFKGGPTTSGVLALLMAFRDSQRGG